MTPSTLTLPYPPSVNELFASVKSPHAGYIRVKTQKYRDWSREAGQAILMQRVAHIRPHPDRVRIEIRATPPKDKRKRDLDNLAKGILDSLVEFHVIADDSRVEDLHLSWDRDWPDVGVRVFVWDWLDGGAA